jgi:hypothetical protein
MNDQGSPLPLAEPPADTEVGDLIADRQFMHDLNQLKALRSFLIQAVVSPRLSESPIYFGSLNTLRYGLTGGRLPTSKEWALLEELTNDLYSNIDGTVRRRFLYGQLPTWVTLTAIVLGVVAFVSLVVALGLPNANAGVILAIYMIWLAALGAIGSIAFVGMNALAVQADVTFDMTNTKLIVLRIVLGALFGIVLTLPFGFASFGKFLADLSIGGGQLSAGLALQSVLLLLPFILGFSTSLVIMILNQFVEAVQMFFGKRSGEASAQPARQSAPSSAPRSMA